MSYDLKSIVYEDERVKNKNRKFGSALHYYPAILITREGKEVPMLFTANDLKLAVERASKNMEDIPKEKSGFLSWLFG